MEWQVPHPKYSLYCLSMEMSPGSFKQNSLARSTYTTPILWWPRRWTEHLKNWSRRWPVKLPRGSLVNDCFSLYMMVVLRLTCVWYRVHCDQKQSFHSLQLLFSLWCRAMFAADSQHESMHIIPYLNSCPTGITSNSQGMLLHLQFKDWHHI